MKLSAPIYVLKRRARLLSRTDEIPYHTALDRIARGEGWQACHFLSCEFNEDDIRRCFVALGEDAARFAEVFQFKYSDDLRSDFIIDALRAAPRQSVVVVDYLQALEHNRTRPELAVQIAALKNFAEESGLAMLFVSQIRRSFDANERPTPGLADVRLPNPLNLSLFSKAFFMHDGHTSFVTP